MPTLCSSCAAASAKGKQSRAARTTMVSNGQRVQMEVADSGGCSTVSKEKLSLFTLRRGV